MSYSFDTTKADVVFVGGGPVALWTAIQTKMRSPSLNVVVLEKYADYQRIHNLFIEASSLKTDCKSPEFDDLVASLKSKAVVSTRLLENSLAEVAAKVGVVVQKNINITDPKKDLECFSNAKVIVGADGSHSIMRQHIVGKEAELCFKNKQDLHYIADLTYQEVEQPLGKLAKMTVQSRVGNCIYEIHSNTSQKTTLRTFISAESYEKMKHATRKTPENINSSTIDTAIRSEYLEFLKYKYGDDFHHYIDLKDAIITTTTLGAYTSEKMIKQENDRTYCLIGDAAFGVPFFKSLNNGLISGTHLSKVIANSFKKDEEEGLQLTFTQLFKFIFSTKDESFDDYEDYMQAFADRQTAYAKIKSLGLDSWISLVGMKSAVNEAFEGKYLKSAYSIKQVS